MVIESDVGSACYFSNTDYEATGAKVIPDVWSESDIVMKLRPPTPEEASKLGDNVETIAFPPPLPRR